MSIDDSFRVRNGLEVPTLDSIAVVDVTMPSVSPSLYLNFVNTPELDPRVSFARTTTATYVDSTGLLKSAVIDEPRFDHSPVTRESKGLLIEEARTNLLTYSEDFDNASWTLQNTSILGNTAVSPTGNVNADTLIESATVTTQHLINCVVTVSSGSTYTFSCFVKNAVGTRKLILTAFGEGYSVFDPITGSITQTGGNVCSATNCGNGWWRFSAAITKTNTSSGFYIGFWSTTNSYTGDGTSAFYLYGAQVELGTFPTSYIPSTTTVTSRASVGTYYDSTGTLQTAAINTARYQYNPDNLSAQPFLLIEPARTNFVRNDFAVFNGGTVSTGTAVAPDGTTSRKFVPTAGVVTFPSLGGVSNASTFTLALNSTIDITYTGYFAASGTLNYKPSITLELNTGTTTNKLYCQYRLNLALGTVEASSTPSPCGILTAPALTRQAKGMYKFSVVVRYTQDATARDTVAAYIQCYNEASVQSGYTADGVSGFQAALLQCELSSYPTSYIPTTTAAATRAVDVSSSAAATRAADQVNIQNIYPWFNPTEGTLFAEAIGTTVAVNTYPTLFGLRPVGDTGSNTTIELFLTQAQYNGLIRLNGPITDQANYAPSATITASNKVALAYKTNDFAMTLNSGTVYTDTSVILPTNLVQARIGYNAGNSYINGWVERIMYYPRRLSNTELQAITS